MTPNLRRWLIPDIALVLSAIIMLYCLTSFNGMQKLFRDSDTGWHVRNGETILATKSVPRTEPYSYSKPGGPWFAWEWLADCAMALAHQWDGLRGVFILYLVTLGLIGWLWFQLVWTVKVWFLLGAASTWVMLTTCNIHWLARPHLFSWVLLLLALLAAERAPARLNAGWLFGIFLLGVIWANVHGSFFLGVIIFFLYAGQRWWERDSRHFPLAVFGFLLLGASLLNPYGWQVHSHIFHYLRDKELLSRIGEFQTFNFHVDGAEALVIGMVIVATGISLNWIQGEYARAALCVLFFVGALRSARGLPMLALLGLPLALAAICRACESLPALAGIQRYNWNLRSMESGFRGYALMPLLVLLFVATVRSPLMAVAAGFPEQDYPVRLAAQLEALPAEARIFSSDKFGGYMIYRFAGKRKVFFDGRSDYYGADFLQDYLLLPDTKPGWREQWNRWGFTHALVPKDVSLTEMLPLLGWKQIGQDEVAILFEKGMK
ncbi:MAG: hypothetical protein ACK6DZ_16735 [Acidobacteriota bacterium]